MTTAWMREARRRQEAYAQHERTDRFVGDMRDQAKQAYAEWFRPLPWDKFATFALVMGARESAGFAWRAHDRWSRTMHHENGRQLRQVVALEYQKRGTAHLHCLVHGVAEGFDNFHAMAVWERVSGGGYSRIYDYNPRGGAEDYCAKYVSKDMELRLIGPWPVRR